MKPLLIADLGIIGYEAALALQQRIAEARKRGGLEDVLLLCEHPHVLTLGRNAKRRNLLVSEHVLRQKGVELYATNRGGDITYHGPGQIVGYPLLDLNRIRRDVGWYVRTLEEVMIRASTWLGVSAFRVAGKTGIWVEAGASEEKLAAIGVHLSRWITSHGFAYNVSTDLRYFELIVPCGIPNCKTTSLEKILRRSVSVDEVKPRLVHHLSELFSLAPLPIDSVQLERELAEFEQAVAAPP